MKENKQNCTDLFSKKPKTKNKRNLLFVTTVMLTALSTQTIETDALTYTNLSEKSAITPSNIYGRVVESQTKSMYRDKELTDTPITQVRAITPMLEFWRWKNNGAWTQPDSQAHREIQPQTTYREKDLTDKSGTTIEVTGNPTEWTNQDVKLIITATDSQSGVKQIELPDGKVVTGDTVTYTVKENGDYKFKVINNAGHETTETVKVTKIDKTLPTVTVAGNPTEWKYYETHLVITAWDSESGVKQIELPDGTIVSSFRAYYRVGENGDYEFKVTDNAGNVRTETVKVTKLDTTRPTIEITGIPTEWTNQAVTLTIKGFDPQSGVKEIELPDGTIVKGDTATYTVEESGFYIFRVRDNSGCQQNQQIYVGKIDKTAPTIKFQKHDAWSRRDVVIIASAFDIAGVKEVVLPNGEIVTAPGNPAYFPAQSYKVSENGNYTFIARDIFGHETTETVSVTNIDKTAPTVNVEGNPTEWTNQDVTLTIVGADKESGVKSITLPDGTVLMPNLFTGFTTTGYISEKGEHVENDDTVLTDYIPISVFYNINNKHIAFRQFTSEGVAEDKFGEFAFYDSNKNLISREIGSGDEPVQVPVKASYVRVWSTPTSQTENGLGMLIYTTVEEKPSTIVNYKEPYTETFKVTENGKYEFMIADNADNVTTETVHVTKIDKTAPTVTVIGNPTEWTKEDATLTITATDDESGVKQIELPDGTVVTGDTATYTVGENGNYEFKVTDKAGNVRTEIVKVTKIDKTAPTLDVKYPTEWTKDDVTLTIKATDTQSGVKQIELPDGTIVTGDTATYIVKKNGDYKFKLTDNLGNETTEIVHVTKIDKTAPTIEITPDTDLNEWATKDITLTIKYADDLSGLKSITLPNGDVLTRGENIFPGFTTTGAINEDGDHIKDNPNLLSDYIEVDSLNFAFRRFKDDGTPINQFGEFAFYDKDKNFLGVRFDTQETRDENVKAPKGTKYIRVWSKPVEGSTGLGMLIYTTEKPSTMTKYLPYKTIVMDETATYTVTGNGDYTFKVTDNAGHETTETVKVTKLDKTAPTVTVEGNPTEWTNQDVVLKVKATDNISGVKDITLPDGKALTISGNLFTGFITTGWISDNGQHMQEGVNPILLSDYIKVDSLNFAFRHFKDNGEPVNQFGEFAFYDKDKNFISRRAMKQSLDENVKAPEGTKYIRIFSMPVNGSKGLGMLVYTTGKPSTITQYIPYGGIATVGFATYTAIENGDYEFKFTDHAGNERTETVNVTKIDKTKPTIEVTGNPTSWANQDVTLTIKGADRQSGVQSINLPVGEVANGDKNLFTGFITTGWISDNGQHMQEGVNPILLSDYIKVDSLNFAFRHFKDNGEPVNQFGEFAFYDKDKNFISRRAMKQSLDENVKAPEGTKYIRIFSMPVNGSKGLGMLVYTTGKPSTITKYVPYGEIVQGDTATFTVSESGWYTFKVFDKAGNETTETVHVTKLDKTAPTVTVEGNPTEWTNQDVTLTIKATDNISGVKDITLPDGTFATISENLFPGFTTNGWINANGAHVNQNGSELLSDYIKVDSLNFAFRRFKDNGEPVNKFGEFAFYDKDKKFLGVRHDSAETRDENVRAPEGTKYIRVWSKPVAGNKGAGMLVYTKEKPSTITKYEAYSSITYTVSVNGDYKFKVTDHAGNETTEIVHVTKIDKTKPTIEITTDTDLTEWSTKDITFTIKATDSQSGVQSITLPDGKDLPLNENIFPGFTNTGHINEDGQYINSSKLLSNYIKVDSLNFAFRRFKDDGTPINSYGEYAFYDKDKNFISAIYQSQNLGENIKAPEGTKYIRIWSDTIEGSTGLGMLMYTTEKPSTMTKYIPYGSTTDIVSTNVNYTVSANGDYEFKLTDRAGNEATETVHVTKLDNIKPTVTITGNPTEWTSQDVTLTIAGADKESGVKDITLPDGKVVTTSDNLFTGFTTNGWIDGNGGHHKDDPNLLSDYIQVDSLNFAFRRFKDNGEPVDKFGEFAFYDKDKKFLGVRHDSKEKRDENVTAPEGTKYIRIWSMPVEGSTGLGMLVYTKEKPSTITFPTYTVRENGEYEFKVTDNAGNETTEIVHVTKIDKTKPTLNITGNPTEWTNQATLMITGTDSQSGIQSITSPDGTALAISRNLFTGFTTNGWIDGNGGHHKDDPNLLSDYIQVDSLNFAFRRFKDNGEPVDKFGEFAFYDKDKKFLGVRHDSKEKRDENVTAPEGTKYIRIWSMPVEGSTGLGMLMYTTEKPSTMTKYVPYGTIVNADTATYIVKENGDYTFKVTDNVGNVTTETVHVTKIDKTKPVITYNLTPNTWTNSHVTINVTATDAVGIKEMTMPNGTVVSTSTASYSVSKNGVYYFKAVDNAGNETILPILITNIDVKAPELNIDNNENWTNQDVQANITGTD